MTWGPSFAVLALAAAPLAACAVDHPSPQLGNPEHRPANASADADVSSGETGAPPDGPYVSKAPHCARTGGTPDAQSPDEVPDAGDDATPGVLALPQMVDVGGPTLNEPTLIAVTFAGDPLADDIEDFIASVGCTDYWHTVAGEYGIGDAVAGLPIRLAEVAPSTITDTQIASWLSTKIDGADPQFPKPDAQAIYIVFYPETTTITLPPPTGTSCVDFEGYHLATTLSDGTPLSYAVVARCSSSASSVPTLTPQQALLATVTTSASHEIIEATTDPQPIVFPAYDQMDTNHLAWLLGGNSEIADMCAQQAGASLKPQGYPWLVARAWSNRAASRGANPCVPVDTTDYFYAAPLLLDLQPVRVNGVVITAPTVQIPVLGTGTLDVRIMSNFASGSIDVGAADGAEFLGGSPHLRLALDRSKGQPGDTIHLTIQKQSADPSGGGEAFVLISIRNGVETRFWGMTTE